MPGVQTDRVCWTHVQLSCPRLPVKYVGPPDDFAPYPEPPRAPAVRAAPVLTAPVWGQQPDEHPDYYRAFSVYLCGGKTPCDYLAAAQQSGFRLPDVRALGEHMHWDLRAREYWTHVRAIGAFDVARTEPALRASVELARDLDRKLLELACLETDKVIREARRDQTTLAIDDPVNAPRLFDNREFIRFVRDVASLELARHRAGVGTAPPDTSDQPALNWNLVPADDLERYRKIREMAASGA